MDKNEFIRPDSPLYALHMLTVNSLRTEAVDRLHNARCTVQTVTTDTAEETVKRKLWFWERWQLNNQRYRLKRARLRAEFRMASAKDYVAALDRAIDLAERAYRTVAAEIEGVGNACCKPKEI